MRHRLRCRKFSRPSAHRVSMLVSLATSLISSERIVTTLPKAKDLRPFVEKMITVAKRCLQGDALHGRRLLLSRTKGNLDVVNKLLSVLAVRYKGRPGGYIRILKNGFRKGDCAPVAIVELVDREKKSAQGGGKS